MNKSIIGHGIVFAFVILNAMYAEFSGNLKILIGVCRVIAVVVLIFYYYESSDSFFFLRTKDFSSSSVGMMKKVASWLFVVVTPVLILLGSFFLSDLEPEIPKFFSRVLIVYLFIIWILGAKILKKNMFKSKKDNFQLDGILTKHD